MCYKKTFAVLALVWLSIPSFAQTDKATLDITGPKHWSTLSHSAINKDGRYVWFMIETEVKNGNSVQKTLVIKAVNGTWERRYENASLPRFSDDGWYVLFNKDDGKPYRLDLNSNTEQEFAAENVKLALPKSGKLAVYFSKTDANRLIIENYASAEKDSIEHVLDYVLTPMQDGVVAVIEQDKQNTSLVLHGLKSKKSVALWQGKNGQKISIDKNASCGTVLFKVAQPLPSVNPHLSPVDVWGHQDANYANPYQIRKTEITSIYTVNMENHQTIPLTGRDERVLAVKGDLAIIDYNQGEAFSIEKFWNEKARSTYYLLSLKDGSKRLITKDSKEGTLLNFSPNGKFILITNQETLRFSSYDTRTGLTTDISKNHEICTRGRVAVVDGKGISTDFVFVDDHYLVVRDEYDLWKLDLSGQKAPLNLTEGYGSANKIVFRPFNIESGQSRQKFSKELNGYLVTAFDEKDKSWGFYRLKGLNGGAPTKLSMEPYYYGGDDPNIKRAEGAAVYLVQREAVNESINLFTTTDFRSFKPLSDIRPEKEYNWMSVDLLRWKDYNGRNCDGLLYKPENFDPKLKYPVVTLIYSEFSSMKNRFPNFKRGDLGCYNVLPIAWLVSNGFLVFIPDITKAKPGNVLKNSRDILIPGIEYLGSLPYVNPKKIGLQGASWGGVQTNYMVTQTNLFAAAHAAAGFSEYISQPGFSDEYMQRYYMIRNVDRFGGLLTEVPESYISQSALFSANKVTTPLLIRHNKLDGAVAFYQSLQYFRMLRRLGKKSWLLQYDEEGHGNFTKKNLDDMNLRIAQFFDHYLKDKPAPRWMTQGIPLEQKQVDSGLQLDTTGAIP